MPNWCENELVVEGSELGVKDFKNKNSSYKTTKDENGIVVENFQELSFRSSVPRPKKEESNWYAWSLGNWGTKWDISDADVSEIKINDFGNHCMRYVFDTAWSPPVEWLESTSKKYPHLRFHLRYWEPLMQFEGFVYVENGRYLEEKHNDYSDDEIEDGDGRGFILP